MQFTRITNNKFNFIQKHLYQMAKDQIINFKDDKETKEEFEKICEENCTTVSHELRLFVRQYIRRNKSSAIPLKDLNKNRKP